MKCPLCESTEFQDWGKTVAGDRKYRCEICHSFFTRKFLQQTQDTQSSKLRLPNINFLSAARERLQKNKVQNISQISQNIFYFLRVSKITTIAQTYLDKKEFIIAIAILYQVILVSMTIYYVAKSYPDISWEAALNLFNQNDAHHYVFLSQNGYQIAGKGVEFIVFFPLYPLLIHLLTPIFSNPYLAGLVISNISSIIGHTAFAMYLLEAGFEWKYNKYAIYQSLLIPLGTLIYLAINFLLGDNGFISQLIAIIYQPNLTVQYTSRILIKVDRCQ